MPDFPADPAELARLIAIYLPQFHPIDENNEWWGEGFTEWTNVTRGWPQFKGHHQPHLPADLGFYDLRLPEARRAQADLAREYGIHGFCYYHYWFNGRRIIDRPFAEVLASGEPDFPFCLCWANEPWSRRWDGSESHVLIGQNYHKDDDVAHMRWLATAFQDPRYIRVEGKPIFLVYRASHLPNIRQTTDNWREEARRLGLGELFLCGVEAFEEDRNRPPAPDGFDAKVEFAPDGLAMGQPLRRDWFNRRFRFLNPSYHRHKIYSYETYVRNSLNKPTAPFERFRCVTPDWDNTVRRKREATIMVGSTPGLYREWLEGVVEQVQAKPPERRIVFINAWNEWAEGNHLEPDQRWGRAYLEATRQAIRNVARRLAGRPGPIASAARPVEAAGRPLRITFVLPAARHTGTEQVIARHANGLRLRGHHVTLAAPTPGGWKPGSRWTLAAKTLLSTSTAWRVDGRSNRLGVACRTLTARQPDRPQGASHFAHYPLLQVDWVAGNRPVEDRDLPDADVVIATDAQTAGWVAALSPAKGAKVHFIQRYEAEFDQPAEVVDAAWRLPLRKVVAADWLAELAEFRFSDRAVAVAPEGVDLKVFDAPPRAKQDRPTVGVFYTPSAPAAWATSLAVLAEVARRVPALRIRAFGMAEPTTFLPLPPGAEFHLAPVRTKMRAIYSGCDAWLFANSNETFHQSPFEVMACRCPVVETRLGGPAEALRSQANGAGPASASALADRILAILDLPEERWRDLSGRVHAEAGARTWDEATDRFEQALRDAVAGREPTDRAGKTPLAAADLIAPPVGADQGLIPA